MYFLLYSHNQVVHGKEKSAIYDLDNEKIIYIPNVLVSLLEEMRHETVAEIKKKYTPERPEVIDQYLQFLIKNGLGFYTKESKVFPKMTLDFYDPGTIRDAILVSDIKLYNLDNALQNLADLGCRYVELRLNLEDSKDFKTLNTILERTKKSLFVAMTLYIEHRDFIHLDQLSTLYASYPKIKKIIIHGAPHDQEINESIFFKKKTLEDIEKQGETGTKHIINIPYFAESLSYNTLYNRKVAIDNNGGIKNLLHDEQVFGHIDTDPLDEIVASPDFQKFWRITVDMIEGLKENPLRHAVYNTHALQETGDGRYILQTQ